MTKNFEPCKKDLSRKYSQLKESEQNQLKAAVIQTIKKENEAPVWSAVVEVASAILRKNSNWPEFFQLVQQACEG